ncbi:hypothetical protein C2S51_007167 [Perilla frutescens var. frutescens]|nr:hypothetical protein C2S51_007167 [Perilla frutescens var. frutescens]
MAIKHPLLLSRDPASNPRVTISMDGPLNNAPSGCRHVPVGPVLVSAEGLMSTPEDFLANFARRRRAPFSPILKIDFTASCAGVADFAFILPRRSYSENWLALRFLAKMNIDLNVSIENEASSEGSTHDRKDGEGADSDAEAGCLLSTMCRGFSVKKGDQYYFSGTNELRCKEFECSCEGRPDDKRSKGRVASYRKQITMSNCKAKLRIGRGEEFAMDGIQLLIKHFGGCKKRVNGGCSHCTRMWQLFKLNSLICDQPDECRVPLCRPPVVWKFPAVGNTAPANHAGKAGNKKAGNKDPQQGNLFLFFKKLSVDDDSDDYFQLSRGGLVICLLSRMSYQVLGLAQNIRRREIATMKLIKHPHVVQLHELDDEGRLMNFFFRDSRALIDYECFGDMLSVDTMYKTNREFKWQWYHCMRRVETEDEFEECWGSMITNYALNDHSWFSNMYRLKKRWASVFTNTSFSAGLLATSHSEVTNKVLKDLCSASSTLTEFVDKYEQVLHDWRTKETADDALNFGTPGQFVNNSLLLAQVAQVYTRNVYKAFESQFALVVSVVIIEKPANDVGSVDMQFKVASQTLMLSTCYIMSRWCKSARQRHLNDIGDYSITDGNEAVDEMAFVNYVMRITLEVVHDLKNHQQGRKTCLDRIRALKGDVHTMVNKGIPHKRQKARDLSGVIANRANIRDPSLAKRRGKTPITSHWNRRKPNPNPPPSVPKWPDVEPSVQNDTNTERSNEGDETSCNSPVPR